LVPPVNISSSSPTAYDGASVQVVLSVKSNDTIKLYGLDCPGATFELDFVPIVSVVYTLNVVPDLMTFTLTLPLFR